MRQSAPSLRIDQVRAMDQDHFAALLRDQPVCEVALDDDTTAWLVLGHAEVRQVLTDPRFRREAASSGLTGSAGTAAKPRSLHMDGPAHREMRALVAHAFSRRAVERMRPAVTEVCSGLLTELVAAGPPADLVGQFATPMSLAVIGEVLGLSVTAEEHEAIRVWTRSKLSQAVTDQDAVRTSGLHLFHYFQAQIAAQRERPSGGLTAQLVAACDEQQLTEMELLQLLMMLFAAGHETTVEAVTRAVLQLLRGPAQLDRLRQRPELLEIAVEELLRRQFGPTVGVDRGRVAAEDVTLGSVAIRQGEAVMVSLDAANHDARVFPDPKRLDLGRQPNPHLSFGDGPHFCLGAALARLELEVALRSLIWGLPALAEVDPPPAAEPAHPPLGSIRQLMVRW